MLINQEHLDLREQEKYKDYLLLKKLHLNKMNQDKKTWLLLKNMQLEELGLLQMEKKDKKPQKYKDLLLKIDLEEREFTRKKRKKDGLKQEKQ